MHQNIITKLLLKKDYVQEYEQNNYVILIYKYFNILNFNLYLTPNSDKSYMRCKIKMRSFNTQNIIAF